MNINKLHNKLSTMNIYWKNAIENYNQYNQLLETIHKERNKFNEAGVEILPHQDQVFRCFNYFEPKDTKVVLLGQDPYHGKGQATGLCFGVNESQKIPPSLRNICKELKNNINIELSDCTLEKWAKQGVLMLNAALTVVEHSPTSHMKHWISFTEYIIELINKEAENVVFVAWGAFAHNKMQHIDQNKHRLLISSHPSPLSATKNYKTFGCFMGSAPFSKINNYLQEKNLDPIQW